MKESANLFVVAIVQNRGQNRCQTVFEMFSSRFKWLKIEISLYHFESVIDIVKGVHYRGTTVKLHTVQ